MSHCSSPVVLNFFGGKLDTISSEKGSIKDFKKNCDGTVLYVDCGGGYTPCAKTAHPHVLMNTCETGEI